MIIYLGGPMRGYDLYNYQTFEDAAIVLRDKGFIVRSPHEFDVLAGYAQVEFVREARSAWDVYPTWLGPTHRKRYTAVELTPRFTIERALALDFKAIADADAVAFLPGWERSDGCQKEDQVREWLGKPRYLIDLVANSDAFLVGA